MKAVAKRVISRVVLISMIPAMLVALRIGKRRAAKNPRPHIQPDSLIQPVTRTDGGDGWIALDGVFNARDIGGLATADGRSTRSGRIFRTGALNNLSDHGKDQLTALHVHSVFDLRTAEEVHEAPDSLPQGIEYVPLPINAGNSRLRRVFTTLMNVGSLDTILLKGYSDVMIDQHSGLFVDVAKKIVRDQQPVIIHCTAGKDRTGVTIAVLLSALGVPDATIVADYTQSNRHYQQFVDATAIQMRPLIKLGVSMPDIHPLMLAHPDVIQGALDHVRARYGSARDYLKQAGLTDSEFAQLEAFLLA
jgi:protein-tyrosine phosphatase